MRVVWWSKRTSFNSDVFNSDSSVARKGSQELRSSGECHRRVIDCKCTLVLSSQLVHKRTENRDRCAALSLAIVAKIKHFASLFFRQLPISFFPDSEENGTVGFTPPVSVSFCAILNLILQRCEMVTWRSECYRLEHFKRCFAGLMRSKTGELSPEFLHTYFSGVLPSQHDKSPQTDDFIFARYFQGGFDGRRSGSTEDHSKMTRLKCNHWT